MSAQAGVSERRAKIKQSFIARSATKLAEVAYNTIIKIESGAIQNLTIETVQKIAKALDISLDELTK